MGRSVLSIDGVRLARFWSPAMGLGADHHSEVDRGDAVHGPDCRRPALNRNLLSNLTVVRLAVAVWTGRNGIVDTIFTSVGELHKVVHLKIWRACRTANERRR